jgi:uncharacterized Fe-S cluster-containing radical SAM superfamily protein
MSKCKLIKNGIVYYPSNPTGSTYCCVGEQTSPEERKRFPLSNWNKKREYELAEYEKSKQGWLLPCHECKLTENTNIRSQRKVYNENLENVTDEDTNIYIAKIMSSNVCNLSCRMCGPNASTRWQNILKKNPNKYHEQHVRHECDEPDLTYLKQFVLTDKLEHINFSGGEPLLGKWNEDIMNYLKIKDYCKQLDFSVVTNGSIKFSDKWINSINSCKSAHIRFSIDGVNDVFNYIRADHSWDKLLDVLQDTASKIDNGVDMNCSYVMQALNAHTYCNDMNEITTIFKELGHSNMDLIGEGVQYCSDQALTFAVVHPKLREKYNITELAAEYEFSLDRYRVFMGQMAWQDRIHNTSLKEHNSDFFNTEYYPQELIDAYYYKGVQPYV